MQHFQKLNADFVLQFKRPKGYGVKKETFKEFGKYLFDIAKILIAIAVVTPIAKDEPFSIWIGLAVVVFTIAGVLTINKGAKDE